MIRELEELIRDGKLELAEQRLQAVKIGDIPRRDAVAFANIARRIEQPKLALRILGPIVRSDNPHIQPATGPEKIEYAESLRKLGAVSEAIRILGDIEAAEFPEVNLYLASCFVSQWQYGAAIPLFRAYVQSLDNGSYAMSVGKVNLAAALIHENHLDEARELLGEIQNETQKPGLSRLHANSLELSAQLEVRSGNWGAARAHLAKAAERLKEAKSSDVLFIKKWRAIVDSLESDAVTGDLLEVREKAIELSHWETLRDCDFHIGKIRADSDLLLRIYFGTPYQSYRERIVTALGGDAGIPDAYLWSGDRPLAPERVLDLARAEVTGGVELAAGQAVHRLMILLSRDFYRPAPLVSVFSRVFPDEYYNPDGSANRVHQLVRRARAWIKEAGVPVEIGESQGTYRLQFNGPFAVRIPRDLLPLAHKELEFVKLRCLFAEGTPFSTKEVAQRLGCSPATAGNLMKWAVYEGKVQVQGAGPQTRYLLNRESSRARGA